MKRCIICGEECNNYICEKCAEKDDLEAVCMDLMRFKPEECKNELWLEIANQFENPYELRELAFEIAEYLASPRKQLIQILSLANNRQSVIKENRNQLYEIYDSCDDIDALSQNELNTIKGFLIDALYKDYLYQEAEDLTEEVLNSDDIPFYTYATIAEFYTKTRRYSEADSVLAKSREICGDNDFYHKIVAKRQNENNNYREKKEKGKTEYMPNPKGNKDEIKQRYLDFLNSIGIDTGSDYLKLANANKIPSPIKKEKYPEPVFIYEPDFDNFVAFDLETTGLSSNYNSIIEIGAIKVKDGEIIEKKEFTFQEFVKPFRSMLTEEVEELTGITLLDLMSARQMWKVFTDFMDFVGGNVLLGYNCNRFDSKFMTRAGRYSHIEIKNPYFDVMLYAEQFRKQLGITSKGISLELLCDKLGVTNPEAHRALADAITTAKVFLELKKLDE